MCITPKSLYNVWLFPKRQILDFPKLKEFAEDNFELDEQDVKFSKWIENTVGKGEIARDEQFLHSLQCFQKACTADTLKPGLVWERVKKQVKQMCVYNSKVTV